MASQAKVLYDFEAVPGSGEICLAANEIITVTDMTMGEGWWTGVNSGGENGHFPTNYVELIANAQSSAPVPIPSAASSSYNPAQAASLNIGQGSYNGQTHDLDGGIEENSALTAHDQNANAHAASYQGMENRGYDEWNAAQGPSTARTGAGDDNWEDEVWDDASEFSPITPMTPLPGTNFALGQGQQQAEVAAPGPSTLVRTNTMRKGLQRFSMYAKHGMDGYLSGKVVLKNKERILIMESELGAVWEYPPLPLICMVDDPTKGTKLHGLKSYIEYRLIPKDTLCPVSHRYKHFDWLHERLVNKFGVSIPIPPLPEKQMAGRFEHEFIQLRKERLQAWLNRICRHPVISQSEVFQHFLRFTDEKAWKTGKRRAEKDEAVGAALFSMVDTPPDEITLTATEQTLETFGRFVKAMDETTKTVLSVGQDHWKTCSTTLSKELQRFGKSLGDLSDAFKASAYTGEDPTLTDALSKASQTYDEIATIVMEQPKNDWHYLMECNLEYKGILACFPDILATHKGAVDKLKECDKLINTSKMSVQEKQAITTRVSVMSYAIQAEANHFHYGRIYDYRQAMKAFLAEQIGFYQKITGKLQEALLAFDSCE
ncbi:sorting nexin-9 isoform X1 [Lethenteron reissneri]|uniref:sorting nexin-9 isoform X1 n=1 Tax=Lethenteron reissneri TaxID=7753 RepID=UPI002AB61494|nr:sorting nexin-9 isoform X1 [Lethenteron reissneri]